MGLPCGKKHAGRPSRWLRRDQIFARAHARRHCARELTRCTTADIGPSTSAVPHSLAVPLTSCSWLTLYRARHSRSMA